MIRTEEMRGKKRKELLRLLLAEEGLSFSQKNKIIPRENDGPIPLSFAQERLWILNQFEPHSAVYNMSMAVRLCGDLDVEVLKRSFHEMVRRHEVLRTTFGFQDGQPVQRISMEWELAFSMENLDALNPTEQEERIDQLTSEEGQRVFDLTIGPLVRMKLLMLSPQAHVLVVTMHHIVSDGWSMNVFIQEITKLYEAYCKGQSSPLLPPPIQYADFAIWQRQWLSGAILEEQLAYWKNQLNGVQPTLRLPTDRPRSALQGFAGTTYTFALSEELLAKLHALRRREGVTLFVLMLAAFEILLARHSGQQDFCVGTPIANRTRLETEMLIGFLVNTLVIRADTSGDPSVTEMLQRVRDAVLSAQGHQDLPFEKLVQALQPERNLSHSPLFQVMFALENDSPNAEEHVTGLDWTSVEKIRDTTTFDLTLELVEDGRGLKGLFEYSTDLFEAHTIERMSHHYRMILEGMVVETDLSLSELPMLTNEEHGVLIETWNATREDWDLNENVSQLFEAQVKQMPNAVAVVFQEETLTYQELNAQVNQLAYHLQGLRVGPEVRVGLCVDRSLEMIVGLLGILKAGGTYVPLDPAYPAARLAWMMNDADVTLLLTKNHLVPQVPTSDVPILCLDADWAPISEESAENFECPISPEQAAYMIYTSGSTGTPKGVIITHGALCNHMQWYQAALPLTPADRIPQKYSLSFDVGSLEILAPLLAGARLCIMPPSKIFDCQALAQFLFDQNVTVLDVVPSMLRALLDEPVFSRCRLLSRIICGGEALSLDLQARVWAVLGDTVELHNLYGPTETTMDATAWVCRHGLEQTTVPIGRPIANMQAYVLDLHLRPVPIGVWGELHIGGEGLARGYHQNPIFTATRFIPDPFSKSPGVRLYKTGDRVRYLSDGNIEFHGRLDEQVKVRGFRIELPEIEFHLRQHPNVNEAIVQTESSDTVDWSTLISDLTEVEQDRVLKDIESLTGEEAQWIFDLESDVNKERRKTVIQRQPEFDVYLNIKKDGFIVPPRENQRNWVLRRALDELSEDLYEFDAITKRFVTGSDRAAIERNWVGSSAEYTASELIIEGQQVMQDWEKPLMQAMADIVTESKGDVVEVGFGMGISASFIQEGCPRSHSIIECNQDVINVFVEWKSKYPDCDIHLIQGRWQDVVDSLPEYDGVFFDTYPTSEEEFEESVINSINFAESFFPAASKLLRPGGVFTYYTNEIDSFSRRHQRLLFKYFSSFTLSIVESLSPPDDCHYWWADSMAVVKAVK